MRMYNSIRNLKTVIEKLNANLLFQNMNWNKIYYKKSYENPFFGLNWTLIMENTIISWVTALIFSNDILKSISLDFIETKNKSNLSSIVSTTMNPFAMKFSKMFSDVRKTFATANLHEN